MKSLNGLGNRERFFRSLRSFEKLYIRVEISETPLILIVQSLTDRPNDRSTSEHEQDRNCARFS
jgi:hypothetical protein